MTLSSDISPISPELASLIARMRKQTDERVKAFEKMMAPSREKVHVLRTISPPDIRIEPYNPAEAACKAIVQQIRDFQVSLNLDEEVGLRLTTSATGDVISIVTVGYDGREMVFFRGINSEGHEVHLTLHYSRAIVELRAIPARRKRRNPIGFASELPEDKD